MAKHRIRWNTVAIMVAAARGWGEGGSGRVEPGEELTNQSLDRAKEAVKWPWFLHRYVAWAVPGNRRRSATAAAVTTADAHTAASPNKRWQQRYETVRWPTPTPRHTTAHKNIRMPHVCVVLSSTSSNDYNWNMVKVSVANGQNCSTPRAVISRSLSISSGGSIGIVYANIHSCSIHGLALALHSRMFLLLFFRCVMPLRMRNTRFAVKAANERTNHTVTSGVNTLKVGQWKSLPFILSLFCCCKNRIRNKYKFNVQRCNKRMPQLPTNTFKVVSILP